MIALPKGSPSPIPRIQHDFGVETVHNKEQRLHRQAAVKEAFLHSWEGYKKHAWLQDEVTPVTGRYRNAFGARGATLVDSLDTLLIMGLEDDFKAALKAVKKIDFSTTAEPILNIFETTIRYLGGLLSAYDLTDGVHHVLLNQATRLGDMLYGAFDTPNRLPITRWDWEKYILSSSPLFSANLFSGVLKDYKQSPSHALTAELGTLTLEFTRLSQLTGDPKYYDAVQRITNKFEEHQNDTAIPGLFPVKVSPEDNAFNIDRTFTFGGMSDSLYEYFPKQYMLLGGIVDQYKTLYERAIAAAKQYLFFRPLNPQNQDILVSGSARKNMLGYIDLESEGQHLSCFAGGMVGISAKIFNRTDELDIARKLVDGCIWAYDSMPTGVMPENFHAIPCSDPDDCSYSTERWHRGVMDQSGWARSMDAPEIIREDGLEPGFTKIGDRRFLLRLVTSPTSSLRW